MSLRAPGGVWLSSILLAILAGPLACGDDDPGGGGAAGTSSSDATSSATSSSSTSTSGDGGGGPGGGVSSASTGDGGGLASGGGSSTGGASGGGAPGGGGPGGGGDGGAGGEGGSPPVVGDGRLRVVAANLTSGNLQSWDPGHGKRILQGVDADLFLVQELRVGNNGAAAVRDFADDVCGAACDLTREPFTDNGDLPNAIISRYPIVASGVWDDPEVGNRELVWARVDIPGTSDVVAVSVHFLTSSASDRDAEAEALVDHLQGEVEGDDFVVLGGDFNTDTRTEAALSTLSAFFATQGPYPVDTTGDGDTNAGRTKPYDWLLASDDLDAIEIPLILGERSFPSGLVVDTRTYSPIADLAPALAGDSGAPSMQHMAVVRDFGIPTQ